MLWHYLTAQSALKDLYLLFQKSRKPYTYRCSKSQNFMFSCFLNHKKKFFWSEVGAVRQCYLCLSQTLTLIIRFVSFIKQILFFFRTLADICVLFLKCIYIIFIGQTQFEFEVYTYIYIYIYIYTCTSNIRDRTRTYIRIRIYRGIDACACIAYIDDDCFHTFRFARVCTQLDLRVVALLHRPDQSESTEMPISQTSRFYK